MGGMILIGILGGLVLLVIVFVAFVAGIYNKLVTLKNRYLNAFAQIEVQLKRRHDLIPALVETVKGYMSHERETLEAVITARNQAAGLLQAAKGHIGEAGAMSQLAGAEQMLSGAMGGLFAVMEAYPDLKANQQMSTLQEELTSTENKIAFSRQAYNDSVMNYNTRRQSFPTIAIAGMVGHNSDASMLEYDDADAIKQAPDVSIGNN